MDHIKYILAGLLITVVWGVQSQNTLTKEEAIARFLDNNYSIRLADKSIDLAGVNASKANVGYHPTVTFSGGASADYGSSNQKFQDGSEIQADANLTQLYQGSVAFNYTIYQGGERRHNLDKLYQQVQAAELQKRITIEGGLVDLLMSYYEAAQSLERLRLQEELVSFSQERLDRVNTQFEYGRGSKLEVTNADVDLQRDRANLISAQMNYNQTKRNLYNIMGEEGVVDDIDVEVEVMYDLALSEEALINEAQQRNAELALLGLDRVLLEQDKKIVKARRLPTLGFSADYGYSFQDFGDAGFFAQQQSNGVGAGLNLSWNIYDGGRIKNQLQAIRVQEETNALQIEQRRLTLRNQLRNLYANYQTALELVEVESKSIAASDVAFQRTRDEYQLGRLGQIEFRQSQINLLNAQLAKTTAEYNAKLIEIQMMQLAGRLLDEGYAY